MSAADLEPRAAETVADYRMALAGDVLADVARLVAINALAAEGAARRGDEAEAYARFRAVADALDMARDIVRLAGGPRHDP